MRTLELTPAQLEKIAKAKDKPVDEYWYVIAKFGMYFGWDAVLAILQNDIELELVETLVLAGDKVKAGDVVDSSIAAQAAFASVNSKNPKRTWTKVMKEYVKRAKL
jgi:hypothetical protein